MIFAIGTMHESSPCPGTSCVTRECEVPAKDRQGERAEAHPPRSAHGLAPRAFFAPGKPVSPHRSRTSGGQDTGKDVRC